MPTTREGLSVSPLTTALIAGAVGLGGTLLGGVLSLQVERQKQEGTLIVEAIKTGDAKAAARNLLFLSDAGLIHLKPQQIEKLRSEVGPAAVPVLPSANGPAERINFSASGTLTEHLRRSLETVLTSYQSFFQKLGYKPRGEITVSIRTPSEMAAGALAYYDPDKSALVITSTYASDTDLALREYTHRVLWPASVTLPADRYWYVSIEWGLATYFPCSFKNDPVFGRTLAALEKSYTPIDLTNRVTFGVPRPTDYGWVNAAQGIWGAAFWEVRQTVGAEKADAVLFASWTALTNEDYQRDDPVRFVKRVLDGIQAIDSGRHSSVIKTIFARRGIKVE